MRGMLSRVCGIFGIVLVCLLSSLSVYAEEEEVSSKLTVLEESALHHVEAGRYSDALEIYRQYERVMQDEGWDVLDTTLLMNKAAVAYHAGRFGEALANLKQLSILDDSVKTRQMRDELQTMIEHRIFQKYPNMAFVRGESSEYSFWLSLHQFSAYEVRKHLLIWWSVFFILMTGALLLWKFKGLRGLLIFLTSASFIGLTASAVVFLMYTHTGNQSFGVLMDDITVRHDPSHASGMVDRDFLPGMTVKILSKVPGWVHVLRVDGVSGWVEVGDCYYLRGAGEQQSWQIDRLAQGVVADEKR